MTSSPPVMWSDNEKCQKKIITFFASSKQHLSPRYGRLYKNYETYKGLTARKFTKTDFSRFSDFGIPQLIKTIKDNVAKS